MYLDDFSNLRLLKEVNAYTAICKTRILIAVIVLLAIVSATLGYKNLAYRAESRKLILQNDSLMGANIELSRLNGSRAANGTDSSQRLNR